MKYLEVKPEDKVVVFVPSANREVIITHKELVELLDIGYRKISKEKTTSVAGQLGRKISLYRSAIVLGKWSTGIPTNKSVYKMRLLEDLKWFPKENYNDISRKALLALADIGEHLQEGGIISHIEAELADLIELILTGRI